MTSRPRSDGIVDQRSWLFVRDRSVHEQPIGAFGYHVVSRAEQGVRLDWNKVFGVGSFFIHPDDLRAVPDAYVEGRLAFQPPRAFWELDTVRADAELYAFAPWFEPCVIAQPPGWLLDYAADGYFPGGMNLSTPLVASNAYRQAMSVAPQDYARRLHMEPVEYRRALFIQKYFHVRRPAEGGAELHRLCDEWLVREDWEAGYILRASNALHQFSAFDFSVPHPAELGFTSGLLQLPVQLSADFRAERWSTHKNTTIGRRYARRRWRQRMEKDLGRYISLQHEELTILGRDAIAARVPEIPPWWAERFQVADRLFQEGCPFAAFWASRLFRPSMVEWAIMVTEMTVISAKNLLRSAYQERRLYRMSNQLYGLIIGVPQSSAPILGGSTNLNDVRSLARMGMSIPWDRIGINYAEGYLNFEPWARVFVASNPENLRLRAAVRPSEESAQDLDGFRSHRFPDEFVGELTEDLKFVYRLRYDWTERNPDPARLPPMLVRDAKSGEFRLFPGELRPGRVDEEETEVASRRSLSWRACFPKFPLVSPTILRGWNCNAAWKSGAAFEYLQEHRQVADIPLTDAEVRAQLELESVSARRPSEPAFAAGVAAAGESNHPAGFYDLFTRPSSGLRRSSRLRARASTRSGRASRGASARRLGPATAPRKSVALTEQQDSSDEIQVVDIHSSPSDVFVEPAAALIHSPDKGDNAAEPQTPPADPEAPKEAKVGESPGRLEYVPSQRVAEQEEAAERPAEGQLQVGDGVDQRDAEPATRVEGNVVESLGVVHMPLFSIMPGSRPSSPGMIPPRKRGVQNRLESVAYAETEKAPASDRPRTRAACARAAILAASEATSAPADKQKGAQASEEPREGVPLGETRRGDGERVVVGPRGADGVNWVWAGRLRERPQDFRPIVAPPNTPAPTVLGMSTGEFERVVSAELLASVSPSRIGRRSRIIDRHSPPGDGNVRRSKRARR